MREIVLSGYAHARMEVNTVNDLRKLVAWLDKYRVPGDTSVDYGRGKVYVLITDEVDMPASWIECGDHLTDDVTYDIVIETHKHE